MSFDKKKDLNKTYLSQKVLTQCKEKKRDRKSSQTKNNKI